jgi:hypothetical protein
MVCGGRLNEGRRGGAESWCMAMRTLLHIVFAGVTTATIVNEHPNDPVQAATELLQRVLPAQYHAKFQLELLPPHHHPPSAAAAEAAAMQLDSTVGGKVVLRGTGGVELASALNWYLNEYLNATYDWNTVSQTSSPCPYLRCRRPCRRLPGCLETQLIIWAALCWLAFW